MATLTEELRERLKYWSYSEAKWIIEMVGSLEAEVARLQALVITQGQHSLADTPEALPADPEPVKPVTTCRCGYMRRISDEHRPGNYRWQSDRHPRLADAGEEVTA